MELRGYFHTQSVFIHVEIISGSYCALAHVIPVFDMGLVCVCECVNIFVIEFGL